MRFTRLSKILRLLVGGALLTGAIASGWAGQAPAIISLLALAFCLSQSRDAKSKKRPCNL
jgi:uncharacterized membrane protein